MESDLPLVAVVSDDPYAALSISLIISDLCRIRHCHSDEEPFADAEDPSLILTVVTIPGLDYCGPGEPPTITPTLPATPFVHILMAETCTGNDGGVLRDCFASIRQPAQFRAAVEARLRTP